MPRVVTTATRKKTKPVAPLTPTTARLSKPRGPFELELEELRQDLDALSELFSTHEDATLSAAALVQDDWTIDPVNGNDENIGTAEAPLKTMSEYARRIGRGTVTAPAHVVHVVGDIDEGAIYLQGHYPNGVIFRGTKTVVRSGTLTGVQNWNSAVSPGVDGRLTDSSLPVSWSASGLLGKFIEITSGTHVGAVGILAAEPVAKSARVLLGSYESDFSAAVNPSPGDSYIVYDVTKWYTPLLYHCRGVSQQIGFENFEFPDIGGLLFGVVTWQGAASPYFYRCIFRAQHCRVASFESTGFYACLFATDGTTFQVWNGEMDLFACTISSVIRTAQPSAYIYLPHSSILQPNVPGGGGSNPGVHAIDGGIVQLAPGAFAAAFSFSSGAALAAVTGTLQLRGKLWGLGFTAGYGVSIDSCGAVAYPTGNLTSVLDIQGSPTAQVRCGTTNRTAAQVGTTGFVDNVFSTTTGAFVSGSGARIQPARFGV